MFSSQHLLFAKQCSYVTVALVRGYRQKYALYVQSNYDLISGKRESLNCIRVSIKIPFVICYFIRPIIISASLRLRAAGFTGECGLLN